MFVRQTTRRGVTTRSLAARHANKRFTTRRSSAAARQTVRLTSHSHGFGELAAAASRYSGFAVPPMSTQFGASFHASARLLEDAKVVNVPSMGDSISEGTVEQWVKNVGEYVGEDELVATIETDKVTVEIRAPFAGTIEEIFVEEGDDAQVGDQLYSLTAGGDASASSSSSSSSSSSATSSSSSGDTPAKEDSSSSSPSSTESSAPPPEAKKEAAPAQSGKPTNVPPKPAASSGTAGSSSAKPTGARTEHREGMSRLRQRVSQRLKDAQNTNALLTTFQECDMTNIMAMRNTYKDEFLKTHGVKLGFMSAFVKASSAALESMPIINAVIDGNEILYRDYIDISVAVATPKGLVVPVIRDVGPMSFADVEKTIVDLGTRARDGKLAMEEMMGGTFTISNGGVYGSMMGTPIVNPPQSAILGMHNIQDRPYVVDGEIKIRPIMYLALTYDHRLIDGRDAVTFLRKIKHGVEDPQRLLLDL